MVNEFIITNFTNSLMDINTNSQYCSIETKNSFKLKNINFILQNHFNSNLDKNLIEDYFIFGKSPLNTLTFLNENYEEYNSWIVIFLTIIIVGLILLTIKLIYYLKKSKNSSNKDNENKKFCLYLFIFLIFPLSILIIFYSIKSFNLIYHDRFINSSCQLKYIKNKIMGIEVNENDWIGYSNYLNELSELKIMIESFDYMNKKISDKKLELEVDFLNQEENFDKLLKEINKINYDIKIFDNNNLIIKNFKPDLFRNELIQKSNSEFNKYKNNYTKLNTTFYEFYDKFTKSLKLLDFNFNIINDIYIFNENYYSFSKILIYLINKIQYYFESFVEHHNKYIFKIRNIIYFILFITILNIINFILFLIKKDNKYIFLINIFWIIFYFVGIFSLYQITNFAERGGLYSKGCLMLGDIFDNENFFIDSIKYLNISKKDYYFINLNKTKENEIYNIKYENNEEYLDNILKQYYNKKDPFKFNKFIIELNKMKNFFFDYKLDNNYKNIDFFNNVFKNFEKELNNLKYFKKSSTNCNENKIKKCLNSPEYESLDFLNQLTNFNKKSNLNLNCTIFEDDFNFNINDCYFKNSKKSENQNCFEINEFNLKEIKNRYNNKIMGSCNKLNEKYTVNKAIEELFINLKNYNDLLLKDINKLENSINFIKKNFENIILRFSKELNNLEKFKERFDAINNQFISKNRINSLKNLKDELINFKDNICNDDFNQYIKIFEFYSIIPLFCFILMILGYSISFLVNKENNRYSLFFDENSKNQDLELKNYITNISIESDSF